MKRIHLFSFLSICFFKNFKKFCLPTSFTSNNESMQYKVLLSFRIDNFQLLHKTYISRTEFKIMTQHLKSFFFQQLVWIMINILINYHFFGWQIWASLYWNKGESKSLKLWFLILLSYFIKELKYNASKDNCPLMLYW